jgi:hypothetical protein
MADRVVGRGSGLQAEGRTADDVIAARGFAALRSPLTPSARARLPHTLTGRATGRPRAAPVSLASFARSTD